MGGRTGTLDKRAKVYLGHHAPADQKLIGLVISLQQVLGKPRLDQVLDHHPGFTGKLDCSPLGYQFFSQHLWPEHIVLLEFGNPLQALYAQPEVIELPTGEVQQTQGQPGRQYLVFHDFIAHEFELAGVQQRPE